MTVFEAAYKYGTKIYVTSEGDSLHSIVSLLYKDYSDVYYLVLKKLNLRFDWYSIPAGTEIRYLTPFACSQVYERPSLELKSDKVIRRISTVSYKDKTTQNKQNEVTDR